MSKRVRARFTLLLGASLAAVIGLVVSGGALGSSAQSCGTVTLNEQAWAGSTANTYVVKYVLESKLGCSVKITKVTEIPVFQAMADGKVDAVLEDWNHVAQYKQFVAKQKSVVLVRANGLVGHIGWFIPKYLLKQYPQFKTWRGLKGKESVFKTAESGSQGMFLGGDPSYVQKDKELIELLGLDFKHVTVGAEPAEVARFTQQIKQKKPVIFYWWTPQYLNQQLNLAEVKLPARIKGCQDDASAGGDIKKYKCAYAADPLNKLFSKKFIQSGSPAVKVLRNFKWSNADQNLVAKWIAGDKVKPEKAAEKWVKANAAKVNAWLK
ncbi:MAG TPA: glycine betaine ABC transporter substrate-binding protein [Gaiellaceae bacterium]|jgi:glycine betaine/proline transport system substrate-binding protein|nr:glycine betaine ABC transporter substrate-binding protein [Gaiellaceae bacterium]